VLILAQCRFQLVLWIGAGGTRGMGDPRTVVPTSNGRHGRSLLTSLICCPRDVDRIHRNGRILLLVGLPSSERRPRMSFADVMPTCMSKSTST
jgi:hypothetical protein